MLFMDNLSQMYEASPALCNQAVLPVTQHRWTHLTPQHSSQTG